MFKNLMRLNVIALLCLGMMITSCTKEENGVEVANYGFTETYEMQKNLNAGIHGCLELVFPVSVELPDGSLLEFTSFEDAKTQLQAWKEANPDVEGRPSIIFPVEVITQDGEVLSVDSRDDIKALMRECRSNFPPRPRHFRPCFKVVYPLTVSFPDSTTTDVASRMELKQTLRQWRADNPEADEKPSLVYPITIEYEDGSTVEINSREELIEAKRACREE